MGGPLLHVESLRPLGLHDFDFRDVAELRLEDLRVPDSAASHRRAVPEEVAAAGAFATANAMEYEAELIRRRNEREARITLPGRVLRRVRDRVRPPRS